jgi:hypothetical protein
MLKVVVAETLNPESGYGFCPSVLVISKTSKTKTCTLKFLNPTKTDVQFRNQTI